jgi:hypothetical protein
MDRTARQRQLRCIEALTARISALTTQRETAVAQAFAAEITWAEIGSALGVSAQAAHKRYRWLHCSKVTGETWHEPPLPIKPQPSPG